jgi:hypothetical protein
MEVARSASVAWRPARHWLSRIRRACETEEEMITLARHAELVSASILETFEPLEKWTLKRVQRDDLE